MSVQVNYTKSIVQRIAGLIYDIGNTKVDSFKSEGIIPHGVFVSRGTTPEQVSAGGASAIGVSIRHVSENDYRPVNEVTAGFYEDKETAGVLRNGYIHAQFDTVGGTVDSVVTINASGQVVAAGGGTAVPLLNAFIEKPAIAVSYEGGNAPLNIGLVRLT